MMHLHQPENTKVCPGCGTCLMDTARHCSVCGYVFPATELPVARPAHVPQRLRVTLSLPGLFLLVAALLVMNTLVILGWQKRAETKTTVEAVNATATYVATTYVTATLTPTATRTPAPPTATAEPKIEYTVVSGDSCISVATRFQVDLDSLVRLNKIDCNLLNIGTVLVIPKATATPEPIETPGGTEAPGPAH